MKNPKDFFFYFDLINACESKGRFCQKRLFCSDCLSVNRYHFWTVWATDPRLVSNERYFDVVLGEKMRKRHFLKSYHGKHKWYCLFRKTFMQNWLSVHKIQSRLKLSKSLELFSKTTLKNLSFETNLESVAQSVEEWEQFKEKQFSQHLFNFFIFFHFAYLISS